MHVTKLECKLGPATGSSCSALNLVFLACSACKYSTLSPVMFNHLPLSFNEVNEHAMKKKKIEKFWSSFGWLGWFVTCKLCVTFLDRLCIAYLLRLRIEGDNFGLGRSSGQVGWLHFDVWQSGPDYGLGLWLTESCSPGPWWVWLVKRKVRRCCRRRVRLITDALQSASHKVGRTFLVTLIELPQFRGQYYVFVLEIGVTRSR